MGVVIHEIENLPSGTDPSQSSQGSASGRSQESGPAETRLAKLMSLIRLEASRRARLWAD